MSGDGYASSIVGGLGTLLRDNIRSRNYVPNTLGWAIFANGLAEFLNVVIRGTLRSANYVAGVSGYNLDGTTGAAEFNSLTARGTFTTGAAGAKRVEIASGAFASTIFVYTGDAAETSPAQIVVRGDTIGNQPSIKLVAPGFGDGIATFAVISPEDPTVDLDTGFLIDCTYNPVAARPQFLLTDSMRMRLDNSVDASLSSFDHAFQIGFDFDVNLALDTNEVMARNNGGIATLALNADGGRVTAVDMRAQRSNDAGPRTTTTTTPYSVPSGGASTCSLSLNTGLPGGGSATALTFLVSISADLDNSAAANLTWIGFEIRETNSGGTVLLSGNDGLAGMNEGTSRAISGRVVAVTVTTAVAVVFIRPMFKVSAGTGTYNDISLSAWQSL